MFKKWCSEFNWRKSQTVFYFTMSGAIFIGNLHVYKTKLNSSGQSVLKKARQQWKTRKKHSKATKSLFPERFLADSGRNSIRGFHCSIRICDTVWKPLSVETHYLGLYSNFGFVCVELCTFITKTGILGKIGQNQMGTSFWYRGSTPSVSKRSIHLVKSA